jgi:hypothetical protein
LLERTLRLFEPTEIGEGDAEVGGSFCVARVRRYRGPERLLREVEAPGLAGALAATQ